MPQVPPRAVMDTNVLYAGLRSPLGASFELLRRWRAGEWTLLVSNTVVTEYEEILQREAASLDVSLSEIGDFLDALCRISERHAVPPALPVEIADPDDAAFLHLAIAAGADCLITHNTADYAPAAVCGIPVVTPREFLAKLRALP